MLAIKINVDLSFNFFRYRKIENKLPLSDYYLVILKHFNKYLTITYHNTVEEMVAPV